VSLYKHYKGNYYLVLFKGTHTETQEEMVVYYNVDDKSKVWIRPADMFFEDVVVDGIKKPRFELVEVDFEDKDE
jgi:hypothetical protein